MKEREREGERTFTTRLLPFATSYARREVETTGRRETLETKSSGSIFLRTERAKTRASRLVSAQEGKAGKGKRKELGRRRERRGTNGSKGSMTLEAAEGVVAAVELGVRDGRPIAVKGKREVEGEESQLMSKKRGRKLGRELRRRRGNREGGSKHEGNLLPPQRFKSTPFELLKVSEAAQHGGESMRRCVSYRARPPRYERGALVPTRCFPSPPNRNATQLHLAVPFPPFQPPFPPPSSLSSTTSRHIPSMPHYPSSLSTHSLLYSSISRLSRS